MTEEDLTVIANMRGRIEQCRRLANAITDQQTADILTRMAEQIEDDIRRLEKQA